MSNKSSLDQPSTPLSHHDSPLETLLAKPVQDISTPKRLAAMSAVALGRILEVTLDGRVALSIPAIGAEPLWAAGSLCRLSPEQVGVTCAVQFVDGDITRPVIIGALLDQSDGMVKRASVTVTQDNEPEKLLELEAKEQLILRCGKASIVMTADGVIDMRGVNLTSHTQQTHRILAASLRAN